MTRLRGTELTSGDYSLLEARWIDRDSAQLANLRRVDNFDGGEILARNGSGRYEGIAIPYFWPGEDRVREYRVRRDHPEYEAGKPKGKYLAPPGRGNMLYFAPETQPGWLTETNLPIVLTEGEFKAIALYRVARFEMQDRASLPRFLPVAVAGVWNWRGTNGKTMDANGGRIDETGPISDLSRIEWNGRQVTIVFDRDCEYNEKVQNAQRALTKELQRRGAKVKWFLWPADAPNAKGIDDLLASLSPHEVLELLEQSEPQEIDLLKSLSNDHGNAERLRLLHWRKLRYCHGFKKWLIYDGRRWAVDTTGQAKRVAKQTMLEFLRSAIEARSEQAEKFAKASLNSKSIHNMLSMAESEIHVTADELDQHPYLLNCLNGTVDLKSGKIYSHRPDQFLTKLVHYEYKPDAQCPVFLTALARMMGVTPDASEGDLEKADRLISYLQKAFGYSLTGVTSEKAVFFCQGGGNNGKTTLLSTFLWLLKEYATLLQIDTLMSRQETNNTLADLSDLRGARFVMTSETEEGQRLSEGKLKRITQGMGRIKAVRKHEHWIEFDETHKLWIDANHKPEIRGTDPAIWNRLHLIPFLVTIRPEEIDRALQAKLKAEAEGILAWAVAGSVRWCKEGLGRPPEVCEAVERYRDEMDQIGRFISERCVLLQTATAKANPLYLAYRKWAEADGEICVSGKMFGQRLAEKDITKTKERSGWKYLGIGINDDQQ